MCWLRLCLLFLSCTYAFNPTKMGPFDVVLQHFGECTAIGSGAIAVSLRTRRLNRTKVVADFNLTLKVPFDDVLSVEFTMAQFTYGGFKDNFFKKRLNRACSSAKAVVPSFFKDFVKALDVPGCPFPKGTYQVEDFTFKENFGTFLPVFFYNKYKAESTFIRHSKTVGCFAIYLELVPKRIQKH